MIPAVLKIVAPIIVRETVARIAGPTAKPPSPEVVKAVTAAVSERSDIQNLLNTKPWWQSKTVWAAAGIVLTSFAGVLGYTVAAGDMEEVVSHLTQIATGIMGLLALYGRIVATRPVR